MIIGWVVFEVFDEYDGIVIIYGIDIFVYIFFVFSFMIRNLLIFVVLIGLMFLIIELNSDVFRNFRMVFIFVRKGFFGIYVVFMDKIMFGMCVFKVYFFGFNVF